MITQPLFPPSHPPWGDGGVDLLPLPVLCPPMTTNTYYRGGLWKNPDHVLSSDLREASSPFCQLLLLLLHGGAMSVFILLRRPCVPGLRSPLAPTGLDEGVELGKGGSDEGDIEGMRQ